MHTLATNRITNFVLAGQVRAGATVVQTSINSHAQALCYGEMLHERADVRRDLHVQHFGQPPTDVPTWFVPGGQLSPEQYLNTRIFDHPQHDERALGVKISLPQLQQFDLWEYCHGRCLSGDFGVIYVRRNPVACFISWKQARMTGLWYSEVTDRLVLEQPSAVRADPDELTDFCRQHAAHEAKLQAMCDDRLEIEYRELILDYRNVMRVVFEFLELPPAANVSPGVRRLKNRPLPERVCSFSILRSQVAPDVRHFFDAEDLF